MAVLDAAGRLFVDRGYGVTTMREIAAEAGVSVESVYAQGAKSALLLACVDRAVAADDQERPLIRQPEVAQLLESADARQRLQMLGRLAVQRLPALGPIYQAFRAAADADAGIAVAWKEYERRRYADQARIVEGLAPALRPGVTLEMAADVVWTLFSPMVGAMLQDDRGWPVTTYVDWVVDALDRLLLE